MPIPRKPIGVVLAGGNSSRMGENKALINYFHQPQYLHILNMLSSVCQKVYVSSNLFLTEEIEKCRISDDSTFENAGPMTGLLSVFKNHPETILLVGCDYPFISKETLLLLIRKYESCKTTQAYFDEQNQIFIPMLAIYAQNDLHNLIQNPKKFNYSLQKFLQVVSGKIAPKNIRETLSIDTPEQKEWAMNQLNLNYESNKGNSNN